MKICLDFKHFASLMALIIVLSCSTTSTIIGSWKSPEANQSGYKNLFVKALIDDNFIVRQTIEDDLDQILIKNGIQATSNLNEVKQGLVLTEDTKEQVIDEIQKSGKDGILTISVIDQTSETRYVPGTTYYNPMMYGGYARFGGYYSMYAPMNYSPGYYDTDKNYYVEINLYDSETRTLVWSAQSKTTNPTSIEKDARQFSESVVNQMVKEQIIFPVK
ncbi:hypothetical protein [Pararhodonellum marinum]|uniref:hypothetical protein n=1 Tax=Pararhodonellum marinum TaxID=2755358 RepID=UPI00189098C4|nr:hypothetical protein [Pararhodonellum marinum]